MDLLEDFKGPDVPETLASLMLVATQTLTWLVLGVLICVCQSLHCLGHLFKAMVSVLPYQ